MRLARIAIIAVSPLLLAASQRAGSLCPDPAHPCAVAGGPVRVVARGTL